MRNVHVLGFLLVLLLTACTERGQSLKVKSFFFGLGGGDKKEEKHEEKSEGGKQEEGAKPTQDTKGVNPAAGVSKSGDHHSSESSSSPSEEVKQHSEEKAPESSSSHMSEIEETKHDNSPFIPPPAPAPPTTSPAPESGSSSSPPPSPSSAPAQSGCSCSTAEKPLSDCCHESVYGEKKSGEKRNATITGTITGTITDSILTAKTRDVISVKHGSEKPAPECDHSHKQQSVTTTTHEASAGLHSQQEGGKLPSLHASPDVGKGKFPNGATFVPLVLDANTGQYGIELKTMDMLVTGQDEKIKPFDMLIPFVNENGQIRFVTRRRLRQLVKSGLSKSFSEGVSPFSQEALAEGVVEHKEDGEKPKEKEEHKKEPSEAEKGEEAANSAKSLLQEAEAVLTGGTLFEPLKKEEEREDTKKSEEKEESKGKEVDAEAESGPEKKDSNESEEVSDSSASETVKPKEKEEKEKDKEEDKETESAIGVQDSASVHASEEEEEEQ